MQKPKEGLLPVLLFILSSLATVFLTVFCMSRFRSGFLYEHAATITSAAVGIELIYIAAALVFLLRRCKTVFKFMLTGLVLAALLLLILLVLQLTGLWERIDSVEGLRELIASTGAWGPIVFILLQALQVFLLPLPGVLTVGAGVLMFGEWQCCIYSYIGILAGSIVAFGIGRMVGYRAAAWLVGRETLDTWLQKVKGKDKSILTVMFILPIFPDDLLCFVSGLSTMSWKFFIVMQLIARAISVAMTSFSLGGKIIPYNTWWGILLWALIAAAIIAVFIVIYKKGEKIERWFFGLFRAKKKGGVELREGPAADEQGCTNLNKGPAAEQSGDPSKTPAADRKNGDTKMKEPPARCPAKEAERQEGGKTK